MEWIVENWFLLALFGVLILARYVEFRRLAFTLGISDEINLLDDDVKLAVGNASELRKLIPDQQQMAFRTRIHGLSPRAISHLFCSVFPFALFIIWTSLSEETKAIELIKGVGLSELLLVIAFVVSSMTYWQYSLARRRIQPEKAIQIKQPLGVSPTQKFWYGFFVCLFCVVFVFLAVVTPNLFMISVWVVFIVIYIAISMLHPYRVGTELAQQGYFAPFQFIPWKHMLHYRWFEHRRGLLFLTDDPRAESPLLILPIPDGKADEVQTLLDDVLPGKREEDVEPALARLNNGQMAEAV